MSLRIVILSVLLTGCEKIMPVPIMGNLKSISTPTATLAPLLDGPQEIVAAGQSNMECNPLQITFAPYCHLPVTVTNIAVGGSKLSSWDRTGRNNALLVNTLKQKKANVLLWWQGEADLGDISYGARFEDFLNNVRHDSGYPMLIIIFVQLGNSHGRPEWDVTKAQQSSIRMINVYMIKSEDVPQHCDYLHYDPEGYAVMGYRFAEKLNELSKI